MYESFIYLIKSLKWDFRSVDHPQPGSQKKGRESI